MEIGDRVALKTGGPAMVVEDKRDQDSWVQCKWFDRSEHVHTEIFNPKVLLPYTP